MEKIIHTESAGGVVLNSKGEVLVVSQKTPESKVATSWSLPKGQIEEGEDVLAAAKREIYEESGILGLELVKKLGSYDRSRMHSGKDVPNEMKTIHIFLFRTAEEKLKPLDEGNPEALWLPKEKVADRLTHPKDKTFFESVINEF